MRGLPERPMPDLAECLALNLAGRAAHQPAACARRACASIPRRCARTTRARCARRPGPSSACPAPIRTASGSRRSSIDMLLCRTLRARHDRFALSRPFRISRGVKTAADVVTVEIARRRRHRARRRACPTRATARAWRARWRKSRRSRTAIDGGAGRDELLELMAPGAARNAVDCALWDLEAKLCGQTVAQLIQRCRAGPDRHRADAGHRRARCDGARQRRRFPTRRCSRSRSMPAIRPRRSARYVQRRPVRR